jgi:hypothetical protein
MARVCLNAFQPDDVFGVAAAPLNAAGGGNQGPPSALTATRF